LQLSDFESIARFIDCNNMKTFQVKKLTLRSLQVLTNKTKTEKMNYRLSLLVLGAIGIELMNLTIAVLQIVAGANINIGSSKAEKTLAQGF
jgi:hypothetical protein